MGHNSFIKGSITRLTGVQSLSAGAALHCSYIWLGGGPSVVPVRAQRIPAAMAVMEVSSVEVTSFLFLSFSHKSLVAPGMIHGTNNNFCWMVGPRTRGQEREKRWLFCVIMSTCNCAHTRETAGKVCAITPNDMYAPIITMYMIIEEGCLLTL